MYTAPLKRRLIWRHRERHLTWWHVAAGLFLLVGWQLLPTLQMQSLAQSADGTQLGPALSLFLEVGGDMVAAQVDPDTAVVNPDGQPFAMSALRPGDWVRVDGVWEARDRFRVSRLVQLSR